MKLRVAGILFLLLGGLESGFDNIPIYNDRSSRAGDEIALEALYVSTNGTNWKNDTGWSSSGMSLSDNIYGVTVESIGGELRVTRINLKGNGLSGDIEISEWSNLSELRYLNLSFNSLHSRIPSSLGDCTNLEYLYLSLSDDVERQALDPHEHAQEGGGDVHVGKRKGSENNVWTGAVPVSLGSLQHLKWFVLNWTDSSIDKLDGISSVPVELFSITTLEGLQIYNNNNIADLPFPSGIVNMSKLDNLALGVGKSSHNNHGWVTGSIPPEFGNLSSLRHVRLSECPKLTLDFDVVDFSGMKSLRNFTVPFITLKGSFPKEFLDGTLPNLSGFALDYPIGWIVSKEESGLSGTLISGAKNMTIWTFRENNIEGPFPRQLWIDNPGIINTDFTNNNLTSIGTTDLTNLTRIRNLRWGNNDFGPENWPNLAWGTSRLKDLARVDFSQNRYLFENMLWKPSNGGGKTIFELYRDQNLLEFSYSPQKPFGQPRTITYSVGKDVTIDDFNEVVTHINNVYQWQKEGSNIRGATKKIFTIENAQASDSGTYRLVVTNPGVPDLTLTSEPIELVANQSDTANISQ